MKKPNTNDLILPIGVSIFIIVIGVLIDQLFGIIGFRAILIGVIVLIVLVWGIILIIWSIGRNSHEAELLKAIESLRSMTPSSHYDWLYSSTELDELEDKIKCKDIWIVSYDLSNDAGDPNLPIVSIIKNNIRRNINYTFITPDTEHNRALIPHLSQIFSSHPRRLRVINLPQNIFDFFTTSHIAIYNPNMEEGQHPQVFIELPIRERGHGKGYWVLLADDIALKVVGRFRRVVEESKHVQA